MKFQSNLIFARRALRDILQWYFEAALSLSVHAQYSSIEVNSTPIPTAQRQFLFQHIFAIIFFEEFGQFTFFAGFETDESVQCAVFREQSQAKWVDNFLEIHNFDVAATDLIDFTGFIIFEDNILIGQF